MNNSHLFLRDTADRVVRGQGKFEEIMACAHEIAASTAQLVVSSKVKADRGSQLLSELGAASKDVNQATGNVVASAKAAAEIVEDQSEFGLFGADGKWSFRDWEFIVYFHNHSYTCEYFVNLGKKSRWLQSFIINKKKPVI